MDKARRALFNAAFSEQRFRRMLNHLENRVGAVPFPVAETPLLLTHALRDHLVKNAMELIAQLSVPALLERLKAAVPARFHAPGMDALPNTVQVDFALVEGAGGQLEGKLIELQGFPSLYALMPMMAEAWAEALRDVPGLDHEWSCFVGRDRKAAIDLLGRTILGGCDPAEVALVDYDPPNQKTSPDFVATEQLFGVESVCVTKIRKEGRRLFRERGGRSVPIRRIYNRLVFDELEVKKVPVPWSWNEELDVTWCSHPNWYWAWSKYCLPFLDHPAVPKATLLSELRELPQDLSRYVLKPLFSFAGAGVVIDVTREAVDRVPRELRDKWVLQEKIEYAPAIRMPDGNGVKAEVRVMACRPPDEKTLTPILALVRLSRGKMLGVDFNKGLTWVGGSVGMWPK